jgi:hypothetical protein
VGMATVRSFGQPPPKWSRSDLSLPFFFLHAGERRRRRWVPLRRGRARQRAGAVRFPASLANPGRFHLPSSKVPPASALLPSGAPVRVALSRRIQRLPLLPLLSTNDLNCNLIMSHECFDRNAYCQLLRCFQEQMVL